MHVVAVEKASTCRSKGTKGESTEKVHDCVIACHSLEAKISQMEVVEDNQQVEAAQSSILLGGKRKEDAGMERAEAAKGVAGVTVEEGYQVEA